MKKIIKYSIEEPSEGWRAFIPTDPISSAEDAFACERDAYERLLKVNEKFRKALCVIAYHSRCVHENDPGDYLLGVADGFRGAAIIAKEALKENDLS